LHRILDSSEIDHEKEGNTVNKQKEKEGKQIEQMGKGVLANLSIEELEQRLEMQILSLPIALNSCKADCGKFCNPIELPQ
jgi:hypothetical protein